MVMFFKQSKKPTDGESSYEDSTQGSSHFTNYVRDENMQRLYSEEEVAEKVEAEIEEVKQEVASSLDVLKKDLMWIFKECPQDEADQSPPAPEPGAPSEGLPWPGEVKLPPSYPPRIPPCEPKEQKRTVPPSASKKIDPQPKSTSSQSTASSAPTAGTSSSNTSAQLDELVSILEKLHTDIMKRVENLEATIQDRSREIKIEALASHEKALEQAKKIGELLHITQMRDLELDKKKFDLVDDLEDRAIERAKKMKDVFNGLGNR